MESKVAMGTSPSRANQMQSLLRIQQQIETDNVRSKLVCVETKLAHQTSTNEELYVEKERLRLLLIEKEKESERIKFETSLQVEEERNRLLAIIQQDKESQPHEETIGRLTSELMLAPEHVVTTEKRTKKSMEILSKSLAAFTKSVTIAPEPRTSKIEDMNTFSATSKRVAPIHVTKVFTAVRQDEKITSMLVTGNSFELITACSDSSIRIINVATGSMSKKLVSHVDKITAMAEIGGFLIVGSIDESICIWEIVSGRCTHRVRAHSGPVTCVTAPTRFLSTTLHAASGGKDGKIRFWNIADGTPLATMNARHDITALHLFFSSKNKLLLLCGTSDRKIRQWDMETQTVIMSYKGLQSHASCIQTCSLPKVSPIFPARKGKTEYSTSILFAVACKNYVIRLCDLESGDVIFEMCGHENVINDISFVKVGISDRISDSYRTNFDDNILVSCSDDGSVRYWTLNNGKEYRKYYWHGSMVNAMISANINLSNGEMTSTTFSVGTDKCLRAHDIEKEMLNHGESCCDIS